MTVAIVLAYHIGVIALAYRLGRNSAGIGVAIFFAGVVLFQIAMNGPASLLDPSGCDYGHAVQSC